MLIPWAACQNATRCGERKGEQSFAMFLFSVLIFVFRGSSVEAKFAFVYGVAHNDIEHFGV